MTYVVSLESFRPPKRYDLQPWTEARIEEAATVNGSYAALETVTLSPVDTDPENPLLRNFTTALGTADELWYRVVFLDDDGNLSQATTPVQNAASTTEPYATVDELARILKIRSVTAEQTVAMERVLASAAGEIAAEVGREDDNPLAGWELELAAEVNLERAVEHWQQMESPFGLIGLGADFGATHTATNSWNRHAEKLAPLKQEFGFA